MVIAALLLLWQAVVTLFALPRYILPAPSAVAARLWTGHAYLLSNALITLREIIAGFAAGAAFGAGAAFLLAGFPRFGRLVWPALVVLQSFPVFVIAPMLVLWFGFGITSKVVMTMIIVFFPVASNFADGLARTDSAVIKALNGEISPSSLLSDLLSRPPHISLNPIPSLRMGMSLRPNWR